LSTGDFIMTGVAILPSMNIQGMVMKLNALGDSIWVKNFGGAFDDILYEADATLDGNIIVAGISSPSSTTSNIYVLKLDQNGDTIWTKQLSGTIQLNCSSIATCTDGGYILTGATIEYTTFSNVDLLLTKLDVNGDSLWSKKFGGSLLDGGNSVKQTFDGGFIMTGRTASLDLVGEGVYLIKTDGNGDFTTAINESINNPIALDIYPNPTTGIIHLKFATSSIYTIQIINEYGQEVFSKTEQENKPTNELDISFLQNGIYFLKIQGAKSSLVKRIIKIN
jgi:Secretion system C-terminal sorting domain